MTQASARPSSPASPALFLFWGICLGHQAIGEVFGGRVVRAPEPVHGKRTTIYHSGEGIYCNLPRPFVAGRYHSLIVDNAGLPDCLTVTATNDEGLIMGD